MRDKDRIINKEKNNLRVVNCCGTCVNCIGGHSGVPGTPRCELMGLHVSFDMVCDLYDDGFK